MKPQASRGSQHGGQMAAALRRSGVEIIAVELPLADLKVHL